MLSSKRQGSRRWQHRGSRRGRYPSEPSPPPSELDGVDVPDVLPLQDPPPSAASPSQPAKDGSSDIHTLKTCLSDRRAAAALLISVVGAVFAALAGTERFGGGTDADAAAAGLQINATGATLPTADPSPRPTTRGPTPSGELLPTQRTPALEDSTTMTTTTTTTTRRPSPSAAHTPTADPTPPPISSSAPRPASKPAPPPVRIPTERIPTVDGQYDANARDPNRNGGSSGSGNNDRIVGGYYPNWLSSDSIPPQELDGAYNLLYIFHAVPDGADGSVVFTPPYAGFYDDCQAARKQGRKLLLTYGGAGAGFAFDDRAQSDTFLSDIKSIIDDDFGGGLDGLDWNNFEGDVRPSADEMTYISQELKKSYGGDFLITSPPAPWRRSDRDLAVAMLNAGVLDYVAPQWYDGPGLTDISTIKEHLSIWTDLVGEERVVVGLGVKKNETNYMTPEEARLAVQEILKEYPNIGGAFQWEVNYDENNGRGFTTQVAPLLS